jgi:toxin CptA
MLILSALAPVAVLASAIPRPVAWALTMFAVAVGIRLAWRENALPALGVVVDAEGRATIDDTPVEHFRIDRRGPLMFVSWRDADGRACRRSLWPDTLPSSLRRELRLAVRDAADGQVPPSVAP